MIRPVVFGFIGVAMVTGMTGERPAPAPRCNLQVLNVDREASKKEPFNDKTNVNYDAAGHVKLRCKNQLVFLDADSLSSLSGDYVRMYGHVVYRDSTYRFAADSMVYILRIEKLEARGNVDVLDKVAGSTLKGPWVDYWRQVKGVNDSARVEALIRPTVRYFTKPALGDTSKPSPYILTGAHLKGFGQSKLSADSAVTLDRDSVHAQGDSLAFDRGKTTNVQLSGKVAKFRRAGKDSFSVAGREIRFRLEDDKLRDLRSFLDARVTRGATVVTGDTVTMSFVTEKLSLMLAWNRKTGATLRSDGYDVVGDSLAVETPGELLREIRVFNHATIANPLDTALHAGPRFPGDPATSDTTRNTLSGERVTARFGQVDSAGTIVTRLRGLEAFGRGQLQARSYFTRMVTGKDGRVSPSINYTKADTILMKMKGGDSSGVAAVQAYGHVDGVQLETVSAPKAKGDTTKPPPPKRRP